jgi:hypothetical protein
MFAHLLRGSPRAKAAARSIVPGPTPAAPGGQSNFFVPADGAPPEPVAVEPEDEDERQTLLQTLTENLSLALLSRSRSNNSDREAREWDRYVIGYLCLLSQWLWEDPKSVKDFLDAGGLGVVSKVLYVDCTGQLLINVYASWSNPSTKLQRWIR